MNINASCRWVHFPPTPVAVELLHDLQLFQEIGPVFEFAVHVLEEVVDYVQHTWYLNAILKKPRLLLM